MLIVAGHVTIEPGQRESYLASCAGVVTLARRTAGCLDFAVTADLVDPGRINVFERWASREELERFRGSGPDEEQTAAIRSASVVEFDVTEA